MKNPRISHSRSLFCISPINYRLPISMDILYPRTDRWELILEVPDHQYGDALFSFIQAILSYQTRSQKLARKQINPASDELFLHE